VRPVLRSAPACSAPSAAGLRAPDGSGAAGPGRPLAFSARWQSALAPLTFRVASLFASPEKNYMRFIKELLLAALFTAVFFVVLMVLLPSKASVERRLEINHPIVQVYDFVKTFKQFPVWSPWGLRDPQTTYEFTPALAGPGAQVTWFSARDPWVGEGSLQVLDQSPGEWINYKLTAPWRGNAKDMDLVIAENDMGAVMTTLKVDVDYGWDLLGRVNGLYLEAHLGEDLNFALHQIKNKVESFPDVDYSDDFAETPPPPSTASASG
jgi:uncharacterized protein YndB with AHSA1/START domain